MSEEQQAPSMTFEGKTYPIESLTEQQKYFVGQIQDLNTQASATRAKLDQIEMSRRGFEGLLREALQAMEEPVVVENDPEEIVQ